MKIEATAREIRALLVLAELDRSVEQPGSEARGRDREEAARPVSRQLLDRYQLLLEVGRVPVVVAIVQGACSGCHVRLPTMVESMARRSPAIHTCPHCQRMLYGPELVTADAGAGDQPPRRATASTMKRA